MKILVGIKRVVDYNVRVRVLPDGSGVDTDGVKMSVNPFDEIALEEALRLREAGKAEEVIVVSMGGDECQQQLRTGLAMGADRAIQVEHIPQPAALVADKHQSAHTVGTRAKRAVIRPESPALDPPEWVDRL